MSSPESAPDRPREVVPPAVRLASRTVVRWGMGLWLVVLVVLLATPSLRTGDRSWWVWVPVCGLALGALALPYLARGRGEASDA